METLYDSYCRRVWKKSTLHVAFLSMKIIVPQDEYFKKVLKTKSELSVHDLMGFEIFWRLRWKNQTKRLACFYELLIILKNLSVALFRDPSAVALTLRVYTESRLRSWKLFWKPAMVYTMRGKLTNNWEAKAEINPLQNGIQILMWLSEQYL